MICDFFSWYNFLVSIPLEIKIKYYELDGLARLVLRCLALFCHSYEEKDDDEMAQVNRIVAILPPERMAKQTRPRRPTRHSTPFSSVLQLGWVDFGWIALTKLQQARTKQFNVC